MPKARTAKIDQVMAKLRTRLNGGRFHPGDRFLSNRAVAELFDISYQTAHRLIGDLCDEGRLVRRPQSGTYVAGDPVEYVGLQLRFATRARRPNSFGAKMLERLTGRLDASGLDYHTTFGDRATGLATDRIVIVWECPKALAACHRRQQPAILLNDRPPSGTASLGVDSVSIDDHSGGAAAAELLRTHGLRGKQFVIVAGPRDDRRSQQRVAGFQAITEATVVDADGWGAACGYAMGDQVVRKNVGGIFCVNDSLAEGVLQWSAQHGRHCPPIVGFDDAPIAETLDLTTLAIPWDGLARAVIDLARRRLASPRSPATHQILMPEPVARAYGWTGRHPGS